MCYLGYSDCCPHMYFYIYKVSADVLSGLLQVLLVELGNLLVELGKPLIVIGSLHGTSNRSHWGRLFSFRQPTSRNVVYIAIKMRTTVWII